MESKDFKKKKIFSRSIPLTAFAAAAVMVASTAAPMAARADTDEKAATEICEDYRACTCDTPTWCSEEDEWYVCDWNDDYTEVSAVYKKCEKCWGGFDDAIDCSIEVATDNYYYSCETGHQYTYVAIATVADEDGDSQNLNLSNNYGRTVWEGDGGGTHNLTSEVTEPSCESYGYTTYSCTNKDCEYYYEEEIDPLGHSGTPTFTWNGTTSCTAERTCTVCGNVESGECTITSAVTKEPTTTETGIRTYTATITFSLGEIIYDDGSGCVSEPWIPQTYTDEKTEEIAKLEGTPSSSTEETQESTASTEESKATDATNPTEESKQTAVTAKTNKITAKSVIASYSKKKRTVKLNAKATGGTLSYKSSSKKVKVSSSGKVTIAAKFSGTATITITAKDSTGTYQTVTKKIKVTVPKATSIKSVKNSASKKATVKWKKVSGVSGYQIQYATKKNFSGKKTVTVSGAKKVSAKLMKLKKGKKIYVRVRTYKKASGKKYYSAWSSTKSVKIKK